MLHLLNIHKSYENRPLLDGISFNVDPGQTVCLLGASGSGKSTLLRIIAGLEKPEFGQILWNGQDMSSVPVHQRHFGLMFQDYALFPHLTVAGNVSFGPRMQDLKKEEIDKRVAESLKKTSLEGFENRHVTSLSGGEQQRVALARSLATQPRLIMFDEPLGALDRSLKENLLNEIRKILHQSGIPAIYVTHDQEEAFFIADRILILNEGKIVQEGAPLDVFSRPSSSWVAKFLGIGNILDGMIRDRRENGWLVSTSVGEFTTQCDHEHETGDKVSIILNKFFARSKPEGLIQGMVVDVVFQQIGFKVTLNNGLVFYLQDAPKVGEILRLDIPDSSIQCLQ